MADVQPYVLRYWETEFPALAPGKSGGGQRVYSQEEIDLILRIKHLLYTEGFTIAGAKKRLESEIDESGPGTATAESAATPQMETPNANLRGALDTVRRELHEILEMLDGSKP